MVRAQAEGLDSRKILGIAPKQEQFLQVVVVESLELR